MLDDWKTGGRGVSAESHRKLAFLVLFVCFVEKNT
jgi:hypothetical protein